MRWTIRWWYRYAMLLLPIAVVECAPVRDRPPPMRSTLSRLPTPAELAELWVDPGDVKGRDLLYGAGGATLAPDPNARYEFVSEKFGILSYSRGYTVKDPRGLKWSVKLGPEAQPEVVASRLIWAAGYHQLPAYYVEHWQLFRDGKGTPQPGARFRPKLPRVKKRDTWSWQQNPFVGTRPFSGLIVLMLMLDNWDMTTANNAIYDLREEREGARQWYMVQDVGASFSRLRGRWIDGARGEVEAFARQGFIESVNGGRVEFAWPAPHRDLTQNITADDVHWIAEQLARLSSDQWDDAIRAGGYTGEQARLLRRTLDARIAQALRP